MALKSVGRNEKSEQVNESRRQLLRTEKQRDDAREGCAFYSQPFIANEARPYLMRHSIGQTGK